MFKPYLWVVIIVNLAAFVLNKHLLRSWVLQRVESGPFVILVNSLPNLVEAVVGTVTLAGMLMSLRDNSESLAQWLTDGRLYFWSDDSGCCLCNPSGVELDQLGRKQRL